MYIYIYIYACICIQFSFSPLGHVAGIGERRGSYRNFVGKPEGKRLLERPRRRWEDNIKMIL